MTKSRALPALILGLALASCVNTPDRPGRKTNQTAGEGGASGDGGSGGSGGATQPSGMSGSGGTGGTGGGATGGGGSGPLAGSGGGGSGGTTKDAGPDVSSGGADSGSAAAWPGCLEPVFSGVMPMDFCTVYGKVCTFTGAMHYTSMADCMTKFHGMSSDGDACKSGHLCRASMMSSMMTADCASSGTGKCSN
jgi:hypothetical protein